MSERFARLDAVAKVKDWTRERFALGEAEIVMVSEVASKLPGYPPLQTAVSFWTRGSPTGWGDPEDRQRHHFTVFKRVEEIEASDIPPAFMKSVLALSDGVACACC